ncbi:MAG: EamA family transporter [Methylotenera sp.]|nr:EamA family transporter [Methylotenera sp.]
MTKFLEHVYIFSTIIFTVYSQLIMRWQVSLAGELPQELSGKLQFVGNLLLDPWVFSGIVATFLAGVSWMLAMTKFEVSYAFPYVSLNYVLILFASFFIFNEQLSIAKLIGTLIVVLGIIVIAKG